VPGSVSGFVFRRRSECKIEFGVFQRIFVFLQLRVVARHGHREARRQTALEETRPLQIVKARQIVNGVQAEMFEKCLRSCRR
jgi:hypothetical protein